MRAVRSLLFLAVTAALAAFAVGASATPPPGYTLEWSEQFNEGTGHCRK